MEEIKNDKNVSAPSGTLSWPDVCRVIADCLETMGRAVEACDDQARFTILFGASWSAGEVVGGVVNSPSFQSGKEERIRTMSTALGSAEMGRLIVSDMRMRYSQLFEAPEGERQDIHVAGRVPPEGKYS